MSFHRKVSLTAVCVLLIFIYECLFIGIHLKINRILEKYDRGDRMVADTMAMCDTIESSLSRTRVIDAI